MKKFKKKIVDSYNETLSVSILTDMCPKYDLDQNDVKLRPGENFLELMNWSLNIFSTYLKDHSNLNKYIHDNIIIDGNFLAFCKENKINVECLYKDSIISIKNDENFFMQGAFLIKSRNLEFLHFALWHKNENNKDEVSIFNIVSNKNYNEYMNIRNNLDNWVRDKDRSNLYIRVIGGEEISYTKDFSWDELFLPKSTKLELKNLVEGFLNSKEFYEKSNLPWKRGFLLFGPAGCGKSSIIKTIISEYNFKPVTFVPGANAEILHEAFSYAERQSPALLYIEDLDSIIESGLDVSTFLNLLDGISVKNGLLVIATANNIKNLQTNITRRPSRFDRKFEISLPNQEMAHIYIKRWFGTLISDKKCMELAKLSVQYELSYAYLKDLYISSMFEALAHNRKTPTSKDIDTMLNRLIKDRNILGMGNEINTDKYFR